MEKENIELRAQVEKLTSKHVALQENHDELVCSHENLVESHAMLEIAHEVIITTVKSYKPHVDISTHSLHNIDLTCASSSNSFNDNSISNNKLPTNHCCFKANISLVLLVILIVKGKVRSSSIKCIQEIKMDLESIPAKRIS